MAQHPASRIGRSEPPKEPVLVTTVKAGRSRLATSGMFRVFASVSYWRPDGQTYRGSPPGAFGHYGWEQHGGSSLLLLLPREGIAPDL